MDNILLVGFSRTSDPVYPEAALPEGVVAWHSKQIPEILPEGFFNPDIIYLETALGSRMRSQIERLFGGGIVQPITGLDKLLAVICLCEPERRSMVQNYFKANPGFRISNSNVLKSIYTNKPNY